MTISVEVNGAGDNTGNNGGTGGAGGVVLNGLLAYYNFDNEDAKDATDSEMHGNTSKEPSFVDETPNGKGRAIFLNASKNQFINIPYNPFFRKDNYSISFWLKDFGNGMIFSAISVDGRRNNYPRLMHDAPKFTFAVGYDNYNTTVPFSYSTAAVTDSRWHLVTLTVFCASVYADSEMKIYIDGVLVDRLAYGVSESLQILC